VPIRIEDFPKSIVPRNIDAFLITRTQTPSFTAIQQRRKANTSVPDAVQTFHSDNYPLRLKCY